MKTRQIISIILILFVTNGLALCADSQTTDTRPAIGVGLDTNPLPALLVKHLGLKTGQGIRISNVMTGSPADKAGLEQDDIIISFEGQDVYDNETLINDVKQAGVGKEVSLGIIHLGQRKEIKLTLETVSGDIEWKYASEPQVEQSWQPGRVFRLNPDDQNWTQIFQNQIPGDIRSNIDTFFNETYSYFYNSNGKQYHVTIEGNPEDNASTITIDIDDDQYKTTIGELDKIPAEYKQAAKDAIENAKNNRRPANTFRSVPDDLNGTLIPDLRLQDPFGNTPFGFDNSVFERMQEQLRQMQQRMQELEQNQNNVLNRLPVQEDDL